MYVHGIHLKILFFTFLYGKNAFFVPLLSEEGEFKNKILPFVFRRGQAHL